MPCHGNALFGEYHFPDEYLSTMFCHKPVQVHAATQIRSVKFHGMNARRLVRVHKCGDFLTEHINTSNCTRSAFGRLNEIIVDGLNGLG